jgi:hypothetical protein
MNVVKKSVFVKVISSLGPTSQNVVLFQGLGREI